MLLSVYLSGFEKSQHLLYFRKYRRCLLGFIGRSEECVLFLNCKGSREQILADGTCT